MVCPGQKPVGVGEGASAVDVIDRELVGAAAESAMVDGTGVTNTLVVGVGRIIVRSMTFVPLEQVTSAPSVMFSEGLFNAEYSSMILESLQSKEFLESWLQ